MRLTILLISLLSSVCFVDAQNVIQLDTLSSSDKNIHVTELATDSNSTSYYIIIKKEVSPHIHQWHSESIFII